MARKTRIYYPGAMYHVMLRGNAGRQIFFDQQDRIYFYQLLKEGVERYGYRIYAFCLMGNHVHLALQVGGITLSKIVQNIAFRYARRLNWKQKNIGHVFQGRYKAILIETEKYLLTLIRYIHHNPIRANLVKQLEEYKWCSHIYYLGYMQCNWLCKDYILSIFSVKREVALQRYKQFVSTECDQDNDNHNHNDVRDLVELAENEVIRVPNNYEKQKRQMDSAGLTLHKIAECVCVYYGVTLAELKSLNKNRKFSRARRQIAAITLEENIATLSKIATFFNRDISGFSRGLKNLTGNDKEDTLKIKNFWRMSKCQA